MKKNLGIEGILWREIKHEIEEDHFSKDCLICIKIAIFLLFKLLSWSYLCFESLAAELSF